MRAQYYRLDGRTPVAVSDVIEWARAFESADRIVAKTQYAGCKVSTVFLGLDHSFSGVGEPLLFETMVFGGELEGEQERYSTWEEAEVGHKAMVERVEVARVVPRTSTPSTAGEGVA